MNVYTGRFLQFLGIVINKGSSYETLYLAVISNFLLILFFRYFFSYNIFVLHTFRNNHFSGLVDDHPHLSLVDVKNLPVNLIGQHEWYLLFDWSKPLSRVKFYWILLVELIRIWLDEYFWEDSITFYRNSCKTNKNFFLKKKG